MARDASGRELAAVHLTGADPYSITAPILAWAAARAVGGVQPAGALGRVEAFGARGMETACAGAGSIGPACPHQLARQEIYTAVLDDGIRISAQSAA